MTIHRSIDADGITVTFVLPNDDPDAPVSVVGSFNDWTPGTDPLEVGPDGSRSATIVVPTGTDVYFRYLGPDGLWFDDPEADEITAEGSFLRAQASEGSAEVASETSAEPAATPTASSDAVPVAEADREPTPEEDHVEAPDETGERLETVSALINEAKIASRDLEEHDVFESPSADDGA